MLIPAIGQPIRIRLTQQTEDYYRSRVVERSQEKLFIDLPVHSTTNQTIHFNIGNKFWLEYQSRDGSICKYETPVLEVDKIPIEVLVVQSPEVSKVTREQRREFVRVPVDFPLTVITKSESGIQNKISTMVRDISGGGLSILIPSTIVLNPGDLIQMQFTLPNSTTLFEMNGEVVRVSERNEKGYAAVSLKYSNIKEALRQKIIQFTFTRQRMMK